APGEDIRVTVEEAPAVVRLDSLFRIHPSVNLRLSTSSRQQSLEQSQAAMQFCGKVARSLQELRCGESASLSLELLPLVPGLQSVSGLVLTDTLLKQVLRV
uniref:ITA10 protein n=1 Tax=Macrostomum lignano TaxID=282301 RepID=A0A1I8F236_9PLAT